MAAEVPVCDGLGCRMVIPLNLNISTPSNEILPFTASFKFSCASGQVEVTLQFSDRLTCADNLDVRMSDESREPEAGRIHI
ncbi:hypothetical protein PRJ_5642 (plasmid) [Pseudomonas sp. XWY-1]|nr:hypothetical protein PVLB_27332 [Pseudomonas sp. VLB120]AUZ62200.1 hypothetical protein PRJ_5642 [Pseudomonas sp. XWY-1]